NRNRIWTKNVAKDAPVYTEKPTEAAIRWDGASDILGQIAPTNRSVISGFSTNPALIVNR
ncbi:MAG: hypothetical protein ACJA04_000439, partial [Cellvibrionaceae bacterium]